MEAGTCSLELTLEAGVTSNLVTGHVYHFIIVHHINLVLSEHHVWGLEPGGWCAGLDQTIGQVWEQTFDQASKLSGVWWAIYQAIDHV